MRPLLYGRARAMGKLQIKLVDALEKPAEAAGVGLTVVPRALVNQAMTIASQRQNCRPQRLIFRVKQHFRVVATSALDHGRLGARSGIGTGPPLTL
jgi:hypothetical protein